jgi:nucleoside-diphosphate-sugar epimerase
MNWKNVRVLVTGGASFIGSHLVDRLVSNGAKCELPTTFLVDVWKTSPTAWPVSIFAKAIVAIATSRAR